MLAAGGTGGHLFPAFALAQELGRRGIAVDLATDTRGDRYGMGFPARRTYPIPSATLSGRSPLAAARTGAALLRGIKAAYALLGKVRPQCVVGFGGYPSFPPLVAARMRGIPTALHEQNAVLGRANRLLARRVTAIATSFAAVELLEPSLADRVCYTGNPVRDAVIDWSQRSYAAPDAAGPFKLLVFGGSQGARFLSDVVPPALARLPVDLRSRLEIVQQCREEDLARVGEACTSAGIKAELAAFFRNLPEIMAGSHLVIARAGASTVAELAVIGRPAILVPLPHALDNDQLQNATRLAESGGGWCIGQGDLTAERLGTEIERLMRAPDRLVRAAAKIRALGRPDAVVRLADLVEELMGRRARGGAARGERDRAGRGNGE
jgi:UDP-N-acetylglucosamine--N-acetylmuramyl-(pentapeptide) pyrophosphoryl-undecaprenol N-acetylglucosamine transferase